MKIVTCSACAGDTPVLDSYRVSVNAFGTEVPAVACGPRCLAALVDLQRALFDLERSTFGTRAGQPLAAVPA